MRNFVTAFTILAVFLFSSPLAMAETFYFYKDVGKALKKGVDFDSHNILTGENDKFPDRIYLSFLSPRMWSPLQLQGDSTYYKRDQLHFSLNFTVSSESPYYFFIEDLVVRDESKIYPLSPDAPKNPVLPGTPEYQKLTPLGQELEKRRGGLRSVSGRVRSRYEIEVIKENSFIPSFIFNTSPFPRHLYLDYKFRIRKEGGPEKVFEGTIPLELVSYRPSLWEKIWR